MKCMISVFIVFLYTLSAPADIIPVPSRSAETIQQGIDLAQPGDTVLVEEGRYFENIHFNGKNIILASHFLTTQNVYYVDNTVIDGSRAENPDSASVVYFINGEDTTATLMGFTVTGGKGTRFSIEEYGEFYGGGGIYIKNASARLIQNRIFANSIEHQNRTVGAGVLASSDNAQDLIVLRQNLIESNQARGGMTSAGGGLGFLTNGIIAGNTITKNHCRSETDVAVGGGIQGFTLQSEETRDILVEHNIITENGIESLEGNAAGGAVIFVRSNTTMIDNVIEHNSVKAGVEAYGVAVELELMTDKTVVERNTIAHNSSENGVSFGGGINTWNCKETRIQNNLIHHNKATFGGGVCTENYSNPVLFNNTIVNNQATLRASGLYVYNHSHPVVANSIFWNPGKIEHEIYLNQSEINLSNSVVRETKWANIVNTVVDMDPCLSTDGLSLNESSPCIGLGTDKVCVGEKVYLAPDLDFSCNDRPCNVDSNIDIGAMETGFCCKSYPLSVDLSSSFIQSDEKALRISAKLSNPRLEKLELWAEFTSRTTGETIKTMLFDDGLHGDRAANDNNFAGYLDAPGEEDFFNFKLIVITSQTGNTLYFNDPLSVTTAGPVTLNNYELIPDEGTIEPGNSYYFKFNLINSGKSLSIDNIKAKVRSLEEEYAIVRSTAAANYGKLDPGESSGGVRGFYILFKEGSENREVIFKLDVYSDDVLYWSESVSVSAVERLHEIIPKSYDLFQNFPNPFNPVTHFTYQLPEVANVELRIYDLLGKEVATLVDKDQSTGTHRITWNASNLASGIYYFRLVAQGPSGTFSKTRKMALLR